MKKLVFIFALLVMVFTGCSGKSAKNEDRTDMDFTVVPREDMPDEIKGIIEEKQSGEFTMSYGMDGYLYIMRGYGTIPTGGYSIRVDSLAETSDEIFFHTTLVGPQASEPVNKMKTCPYIVVKIEYTDKKIVFE